MQWHIPTVPDPTQLNSSKSSNDIVIELTTFVEDALNIVKTVNL